MVEQDRPERRGKIGLPLNKEDHALAFGESSDSDEYEYEAPATPVSYLKLFMTIVIAAPIATFLAMGMIDLYSIIGTGLGLKKPEPLPTPVAAALKTPDPDEKYLKLLEAFQKSNRRLVAALEKQTAAITKVANKKPAIIKIESPKDNKQAKTSAPKIVVVKVPSREKFDLYYEKQKIFELAGLDIDDPITDPKSFNKIRSKEVLKEVIRSLDAIIGAARDHDEVDDFLKSNALKGKRYATKRLKKII